ncbi:MAG: hypothetical protein WAT09_15190 [Paracoccaceae bacterium]
MDLRSELNELTVWIAVIAVLLGAVAAYLGTRGDRRRIKAMGQQLSAIMQKPNPSPLEQDVKRRLSALPPDVRQALMTLTERSLPGRAQEADVALIDQLMMQILTPVPEGPSEAKTGSVFARPPVAVHAGPALVLVRKARTSGVDVTTQGASWLGGLPVLGGMGWPAGQDGRPMTPVAQIHLGELTAALGFRAARRPDRWRSFWR